MSSKICTYVTIARTSVYISTPLPEDILKHIVSYVENKFERHEEANSNKLSEEEKKVDTLIITLLDVAAELFSANQEIKRLKQLETDAYNILNKRLDDFSKQN